MEQPRINRMAVKIRKIFISYGLNLDVGGACICVNSPVYGY